MEGPSVSPAHVFMHLDSRLVSELNFVALENTLISETSIVLMHFRHMARDGTFVPGSVACSHREGETRERMNEGRG